MQASTNREIPFPLTPLDCVPFAGYAEEFLFFPGDLANQQLVQKTLQSALAQTFKALPLLAGSVTTLPDDGSGNRMGRLAVTAPYRSAEKVLTIRDLTDRRGLDYGNLKAKAFVLLDVEHEFLGFQYPLSESPVFQVQLNFVRGGIILSLCLDHRFGDGQAMVIIAKMLSAYCRDEDGSKHLTPDLLDRSRLMEGSPSARLKDIAGMEYVPQQDDSETRKSTSLGIKAILRSIHRGFASRVRSSVFNGLRVLSNLITYHTFKISQTTATKGDKLDGRILFFSDPKLKELKTMATEQTASSKDVPWISTGDALTSLLWCFIMASTQEDAFVGPRGNFDPIARMTLQARLRTTGPISSLAVFVNGRRFLNPPLPDGYIGNNLQPTSLYAPLASVSGTLGSVGEYAHKVRGAINKVNEESIMQWIGAINSVKDISRLRIKRRAFSDAFLSINSWAGQPFYDMDWGHVMGGKCERLRPRCMKGYPHCLILPKLNVRHGSQEGHGGLEVYVCIKAKYIERLKGNELFNRFAEWV